MSMGISVMYHTTDDMMLERPWNQVSTGVIDRHKDRGRVDDEMG
jgi:hypothetical protein